MTVGTDACGPTALSWTGAETGFAAGFVAYETSHVVVVYRTALGVESVLTLGVHYAVTLAGTPPGAVTVTPLAMPAAPGTVIILRETPAVQGVDFDSLDSYAAGVHEKIADLGAMRDAEALRKDGQGNFDAHSRRIVHLAAPIDAQDAANKSYVDAGDTAERTYALDKFMTDDGAGHWEGRARQIKNLAAPTPGDVGDAVNLYWFNNHALIRDNEVGGEYQAVGHRIEGLADPRPDTAGDAVNLSWLNNHALTRVNVLDGFAADYQYQAGSFRIEGLADPQQNQDAATAAWTQGWVSAHALVLNGPDFNAGGRHINNVADPASDLDAVNRAWSLAAFMTANGAGNWEGRARRINNLADPALGNDAVTRHWAETAATSSVAQAQAYAAAAAASAAAAAAIALSGAFPNLADVHMIFGQSNGAGNAQPFGGPYLSPNPIVGTVFKWRSGMLQHGADPCGPAGVDLGSPWPMYAMTAHRISGRVQIIINCAVGSSALVGWLGASGGDWSPTGTLLALAFATCDAAFTAIAAAGFTIASKTVCWVQGEGEAQTYGSLTVPQQGLLVTDYKNGLNTLINAIWAHFGAATRFWLWETGTTTIGDLAAPGWAIIRQAQSDALSTMPYPLVRVVSRVQKLFFQMTNDFQIYFMEVDGHWNQLGANIAGMTGASNGYLGRDDVLAFKGVFPDEVPKNIFVDPVHLYGRGTAGVELYLQVTEGHGYKVQLFGEGHAHARELGIVDSSGAIIMRLAFDGTLFPSGAIWLKPGTTAAAPLQWQVGAAPAAPADYAMWPEGDELYMRFSGVTYKFNKTAV